MPARRATVAVLATPPEAHVKFLSTRVLRNRPGYVRELARDDDLVLTANGKPVASVRGLRRQILNHVSRILAFKGYARR